MGKGYLVTATDTEAGKTFITSLFLGALRERGIRAFAFKPVESGCEERDGVLVPRDGMVYHLMTADAKVTLEDVCPYRFAEPVSPNIAARERGEFPEPETIREKIEWWSERSDVFFVEGAGGILVEIVDGYTFADLARDSGLRVILVAPNRLGVLNHVALNVRFLEYSGIPFRGIVLNDVEEEDTPAARRNPEELRRIYGSRFLMRIRFGQHSVEGSLVRDLFG